jgi:hypothetical protein
MIKITLIGEGNTSLDIYPNMDDEISIIIAYNDDEDHEKRITNLTYEDALMFRKLLNKAIYAINPNK